MEPQEKKLAQFIQIPREEIKEKVVCQWVSRCYENAQTVALRTKDEGMARRLDAMLWSFDDTSFVPHKMMDKGPEPHVEPVLICTGGQELPQHDVFIEAGENETYAGFTAFSHIIDFADLYDERLKLLSRERFRDYKAAGYTMRMIRENL